MLVVSVIAFQQQECKALLAVPRIKKRQIRVEWVIVNPRAIGKNLQDGQQAKGFDVRIQVGQRLVSLYGAFIVSAMTVRSYVREKGGATTTTLE